MSGTSAPRLPRPGSHRATDPSFTETPLAKKRRARKINRTLSEAYPDAHAELDFTTPLELLVATVLSAQCTDVRVNSVTPRLFATYPTVYAYAQADPGEMATIIRPTGFYQAKTRNLIGLSQAIVERHNGEVPSTVEELTALPGVGRKTANVVLGDAFGVPGITVDTHVGRLARRWKLMENTDAVKAERDLMELIERSEWTKFSHRTIFHGRRICHARKPACGACFLAWQCPSFGVDGTPDPTEAAERITSDDRQHLLDMAGFGDA